MSGFPVEVKAKGHIEVNSYNLAHSIRVFDNLIVLYVLSNLTETYLDFRSRSMPRSKVILYTFTDSFRIFSRLIVLAVDGDYFWVSGQGQ